MKKYTKKQIQEAIEYWQKYLKKMNEDFDYNNEHAEIVRSRILKYGYYYHYTVDTGNLRDPSLETFTETMRFSKKPTFDKLRNEINRETLKRYDILTYEFDNDEFGGEVATYSLFLGPDRIKPYIIVTNEYDQVKTFKDNKDFIVIYYPNPSSTEFEIH